MSITRDILQKLNESAEVKKTYGDKPQEGKKESIKKGKASKVPRGKVDNKIKAEKLQNSNSQAADIYTSDTEKLMDKIDSKEQSDRGKVAKTTGTKSDKTIKFPFGDKVQASDSKLIKESAILKESAYDVAYELIENGEKYGFDPKNDLITDEVIKKVCKINNIDEIPSVSEVSDRANELWESNVPGKNVNLKEDYDNGTWMKYQHMIEGTLESAKEDMDEDAFLDFCEGVINLCQNYTGELNQFECAKPCKKEDK